MKALILLVTVVLVGGCHWGNKNMAEKAKAAPLIEEAIRKAAKKPTGELTKADYEKLKELSLGDRHLTQVPKGQENLTQLETLHLDFNQLTDVEALEKLTQLGSLTLYFQNNPSELLKGLEKLTQLENLILHGNPALTKAQIDELQKALPECRIRLKK